MITIIKKTRDMSDSDYYDFYLVRYRIIITIASIFLFIYLWKFRSIKLLYIIGWIFWCIPIYFDIFLAWYNERIITPYFGGEWTGVKCIKRAGAKIISSIIGIIWTIGSVYIYIKYIFNE